MEVKVMIMQFADKKNSLTINYLMQSGHLIQARISADGQEVTWDKETDDETKERFSNWLIALGKKLKQ